MCYVRGPLTSVEKNYTLPSWIALDSDADSIVFPLSIRRWSLSEEEDFIGWRIGEEERRGSERIEL